MFETKRGRARISLVLYTHPKKKKSRVASPHAAVASPRATGPYTAPRTAAQLGRQIAPALATPLSISFHIPGLRRTDHSRHKEPLLSFISTHALRQIIKETNSIGLIQHAHASQSQKVMREKERYCNTKAATHTPRLCRVRMLLLAGPDLPEVELRDTLSVLRPRVIVSIRTSSSRPSRT